MHRSASGSLVNEQKTFIDSSATHNNIDTDHQLPTYDPLSDVAKKELSRLRFAENAVHAIPLVLAFCAIVLWFFSNAGIKLHSLILSDFFLLLLSVHFLIDRSVHRTFLEFLMLFVCLGLLDLRVLCSFRYFVNVILHLLCSLKSITPY